MAATRATLALYESSRPLLEAHPDLDLERVPRWVRENAAVARSYGVGEKGVILPDGRKYHLDNALNDMTGRDWTFFINSVFSTHYPTNGPEGYAHGIRKIHPTPKPPQLMKDLIEFFTKEGELVFDAFAGVGGTLLGAALCGRQGAGIELNPTYIEAYDAAARALELTEYPVECGDSLQVLSDPERMTALTKGQEIGLLLMDPPYGNMMSKEKTGGDLSVYGNRSTPFTQDARDLGNMTRADFLCAIRETVERALPYLKFRGYIILMIKDLQPQKKTVNLLHAEVIDAINAIPAVHYKGMKIWADRSTKLYPYGYPFSFVANQIHQYILVFRIEKKAGTARRAAPSRRRPPPGTPA